METYKDLFNAAKEEAILEFQHFLYLLDIEPDAFEHIYNIKMEMNSKLNNALMEYYSGKNKIVINKKQVKYYFDGLVKNISNKNIIMDELVVSFLHEMIHSNRTIVLGDSMSMDNLYEIFNYEAILKTEIKKGYDLYKYDEIMVKLEQEHYSPYLKKYMPVKVNINSDGTYKIIAYNKETKFYEVFKKVPIDTTPGIEVLLSIALTMNSKTFHYMPDHIIVRPEAPNLDGEACSISDCYFSNKKNSTAIEMMSAISASNKFEEVITEVMALIIRRSRKDKEFNLKQITKDIAASDYYQLDVRMGAQLINLLGEDFVKWFMLSAYEDCYFDYIENKFKDKADILMKEFSKLYVLSVTQTEDKEEYIPHTKAIKKIMKQKIKK